MGRYKADVVIVGGGIAGIVSAFDLLGLGKRVLIVDRDSEANFGGLAKESFGGICRSESWEQMAALTTIPDDGPKPMWPIAGATFTTS